MALASDVVKEQSEKEVADGSKESPLKRQWSFCFLNLCVQPYSYVSANNFVIGSRRVGNSGFPLNWQVYYT